MNKFMLAAARSVALITALESDDMTDNTLKQQVRDTKEILRQIDSDLAWYKATKDAKLLEDAAKRVSFALAALDAAPVQPAGKVEAYESVNQWLLSLSEGELKHVQQLGKWELADKVFSLCRCDTSSKAEAMPMTQEPKYGIREGGLYNRASGESIPHDEPVFIFRARDRKAIPALLHYVELCADPDHKKAVVQRIADFNQFAKQYPDRLKYPDTVLVSKAEASSDAAQDGPAANWNKIQQIERAAFEARIKADPKPWKYGVERNSDGTYKNRDVENLWSGWWLHNLVRTHQQAAPPAAPAQQEPIAWESTTPVYIKYVTDSRYQKFHPLVKKWYKPYRCSSCIAPPAAQRDSIIEECAKVCEASRQRIA
jgi:hypothetical protein